MEVQESVKEKLRLQNDAFLEEDLPPPAIEEHPPFLQSILDAIEAAVAVDRKRRSRLSRRRPRALSVILTNVTKYHECPEMS